MKTRWANILMTIFFTGFLSINANTMQTDITGPTGSGAFGTTVTVLPNGNFVVTDPFYDEGGVNDIGAVFLYNGANLSLISTLKGSTINDQVGVDGVTVLANGNFVVVSSFWDNPSPAIGAVGAVTWCSATTGCNGLVSVNNSLIGGTVNDRVGNNGVTALPNGNYVVNSTAWDNLSPSTVNAGAVTLGNGTAGTVGLVSAGNSLIGGTFADQVGNNLSDGVTVLANGNYVVSSSFWDKPSPFTADAGAVTHCNPTSGCVGLVTVNNSLTGNTTNDEIGIGGVTALTNGNFVVMSPNWNNPSPAIARVGAVTWCNGTSGTVGVVTSGNSLIGGTLDDQIGGDGVTALTNGNYVVSSTLWNNPSPALVDAGAATWGNGTGGTVGVVSASNSLSGSAAGDRVGEGGVTALTNGNYVVNTPDWDNPAPLISNVGAVTWGNGTGGTVGLISAGNSLIGSTATDNVGLDGVTALTNGNYVVNSSVWNNPSPAITDVGAVTWGNGTTGTAGLITSSNSLIGGRQDDRVGRGGVIALTNGNYVVNSFSWDNPSPLTPNVGAVTWGNGTTGIVGLITSGNSLIGGTTTDSIGSSGVVALTNGNYVVCSALWNNPSPAPADVGAATWGNGTTGTVGLVSAGNSLIGGTTIDSVGREGAVALTNGNYVVRSGVWNNPSSAIADVGAVTFGNGAGGTVGLVSESNSLIGGTTSDHVGFDEGVLALSNGDYAVQSADWNNPPGPITDARAVTLGNGTAGTVGPISSANSVLGTVASGINDFPGFSHDATRNRLFVRRSVSNIVSILSFAPLNRAPFDFDGDGKTDISIFRPAPAEWWYLRSSDGGNAAVQFGQTTDRITPGDFTGDGKTDIALWRPSTGFWFILRSENGSFFSFPFGTNGDIPAPADYDGDSKTDAAVFRPSSATWFISRSSGGITIQQFGISEDKPVVADYDGDGKADIAIFRPSVGEWWYSRSSNGVVTAAQFGAGTDKPVQGDYTGDGKADIAFYRPSTSFWFVLRSEDSSFFSFPFGALNDLPAPGDYDGDGKFDPTVFRPSTSTWFINLSSSGVLIQGFGTAGDIPVPSAFVP